MGEVKLGVVMLNVVGEVRRPVSNPLATIVTGFHGVGAHHQQNSGRDCTVLLGGGGKTEGWTATKDFFFLNFSR